MIEKINQILKSKIFIFTTVLSALIIVAIVILTPKAPPMKKAVIFNFSSHSILKEDLEFYLDGTATPVKLKRVIPPYSVDTIVKSFDNIQYFYLNYIMANDFSGNSVKIDKYPCTYDYFNRSDGLKMKARIYRDGEGDIYRLDITDQNEGKIDASVFINTTFHNFGVTHIEYLQTGVGAVQLNQINRDIVLFANPNKHTFKSFTYDLRPSKTLESQIYNFNFTSGTDGPNSIGMEMSNLEGGHDK